MPASIPSRRDISALLGLPYGHEPTAIRDRNPDPGLFGPSSVTWRVLAEPLLVIGGARALLMQVAHPLVAEGALQHSVFEEDPFGRLMRTAHWTSRVAFGTTAEAEKACRQIDRRHRHVQGNLSGDDATSRVAAGASYTARDADLSRWVHATLVDTLIVTYEALVGTLSKADADTFVREWNAVAALVNVPPSGYFQTRAELTHYINDQIANGPIEAGAGSRRVAATIFTPPIDGAAARAWPALTFFSSATLPPALRRQYGVAWSPQRQVALRGIGVASRTARTVTPRALRTSATARFALARANGELDQRGIA